jgi:outer membrane protein, heavy metal efflux system
LTVPVRRAIPFSLAFAVCATFGCNTPGGATKVQVSRATEARFGVSVGSGPAIVPEALEAGAPLTEEQAVVLALWNNALFHEQLVELDLTKADLVQAGLLPNPEFVYFWPAPDKPLKYALELPLEAIWLRPIRVKAATAETERAAARLTQLALDLIRDTRQAYADLQLAHDRVAVAERAVDLRERILQLAEGRLKAGDASELDVSTARVDVRQAQQDLTRVRYEVPVAEERVRNLLGLSASSVELFPDNLPHDARPAPPVEELVAEAVARRPDVDAANRAVAAADERARVARLGWVRLLGILDATSGKNTGHEFGPAVRVTVPLFNRNQGGIARAEAEREQLDRRRLTVHNQVVQEVRTAHARYLQARTELEALRRRTRPEVEAVIKRAEAAFAKGGVTYLLVLEANRQLIDTYMREAQLLADLRRAWAELERGVGQKLAQPQPDPSPAPDEPR